MGAWSASTILGKEEGLIETALGVLRANFAASFANRLIRGVCGVIRRGASGLGVGGSETA